MLMHKARQTFVVFQVSRFLEREQPAADTPESSATAPARKPRARRNKQHFAANVGALVAGSTTIEAVGTLEPNSVGVVNVPISVTSSSTAVVALTATPPAEMIVPVTPSSDFQLNQGLLPQLVIVNPKADATTLIEVAHYFATSLIEIVSGQFGVFALAEPASLVDAESPILVDVVTLYAAVDVVAAVEAPSMVEEMATAISVAAVVPPTIEADLQEVASICTRVGSFLAAAGEALPTEATLTGEVLAGTSKRGFTALTILSSLGLPTAVVEAVEEVPDSQDTNQILKEASWIGNWADSVEFDRQLESSTSKWNKAKWMVQ